MSSFIHGWCISTVLGSLRQFNVVFSPQWISVCKIHACEVAYHAPFHPWVYLLIENVCFRCFSLYHTLCVNLITISRALKLYLMSYCVQYLMAVVNFR